MTKIYTQPVSRLRIVEGAFAAVSAGNCTWAWMVDGDDIQERANVALGWYWSNDFTIPASVHERGVRLACIQIDDQAHMLAGYSSREAAEAALATYAGDKS